MTTTLYEYHISAIVTPADDYVAGDVPAYSHWRAVQIAHEWLFRRLMEDLPLGAKISLVLAAKPQEEGEGRP